MLVNSGRDILARSFLGGATAGTTATATGVTATTLTNTGAAWTVNAFAGMVVATGSVYGVIESNTATILTIDRWYNPATPGALAGTTPAIGVYQILPGGAPALFVGLSTTNAASVATDTTMAGEIVNGTPVGENNVAGTLPSGLVRQVGVFAHTAGAATTTITPVFTVNANESGILPQTIYRGGLFISLIAGWAGSMTYETLMSASATLSAVGDSLTTTWTITSA